MYTARTPDVLRRVAAGVLALCIGACAAQPPAEAMIGLRNPTVPLGGTSRFDADRFAGDWQTVACLGTCDPAQRFEVATDGTYLRRAVGQDRAFRITAPGILRQSGGDQVLVVMWVDEGFRTAAIGDADGGWAAILNRSRSPAPDRIRAATEILDFNGWDTGKLRKIDG